MLEGNHLVTQFAYGCSVGDEKHGLLRVGRKETVIQFVLCRLVKAAADFVKQEDVATVEQSTSDGDTLGLSLAESTWKKYLQGEFDKPYFAQLTTSVRQEYAATACYPPGKLIFNAFNLCPFHEVKVVIIGQDPYHEPGQANGLSFSVQDGIPFPPSLQNIFKEIRDDLGTPIPPSGNLTRWAQQGVLLLNASLTVRAHQANSHSALGWQTFTDAAIRALAAHREHLVYMLWGGYARSKSYMIDKTSNLVLESVHPSPLSANRGGWFG